MILWREATTPEEIAVWDSAFGAAWASYAANSAFNSSSFRIFIVNPEEGSPAQIHAFKMWADAAKATADSAVLALRKTRG
jgi:hypothetical protein